MDLLSICLVGVSASITWNSRASSTSALSAEKIAVYAGVAAGVGVFSAGVAYVKRYGWNMLTRGGDATPLLR